MPYILFLISILVSSSFYVVLERVTQDSAVNQALLASTAAFYTANSSAEVSWMEVVPEESLEKIPVFESRMAAADAKFETLLDDGWEEGGGLELNRGVESRIVQRSKSLATASLVDTFYQSSGEVFLYEVPPDEVVDSVKVEYCMGDEPCPELIIEWFRLDQSFRFHDLEELKELPSDPDLLNPCLENVFTKIRRCVVRSSSETKDALTVGSGFFELRTDFPSYHYLIRFRSLDRTLFHFRMFGVKNEKEVGLPTVFFEVDELGKTRNTFRRIQEQQMVSGGLQDGLEFVHFAEWVENK